MGLNSQRTPKVDALARDGDVAGLVEAAQLTDVQTGRDGKAVDAGAPVREAAILSLARLGHRDASPVVTEALSDSSDRVRCAAIRALCEWGEALPLAEAMAWLPAQGSSRTLATSAITRLADPKSAVALATSLIHSSAQDGLWEEEAEIVAALCSTTRSTTTLDRVLELLVAALGDEDEGVASRAEDFVLWFGADAAPAVAEVVSLGSAPHRCVWILGQIGGAEALEPLIEALERYDARGRAEACAALGELRDPIAVNALLYATHDSDHVVRVKAAAALDRIGTAALLIGLSTLRGNQAPPKQPARAQNGNGAARQQRTASSTRARA
jgi:HEAT repeat protein